MNSGNWRGLVGLAPLPRFWRAFRGTEPSSIEHMLDLISFLLSKIWNECCLEKRICLSSAITCYDPKASKRIRLVALMQLATGKTSSNLRFISVFLKSEWQANHLIGKNASNRTLHRKLMDDLTTTNRINYECLHSPRLTL